MYSFNQETRPAARTNIDSLKLLVVWTHRGALKSAYMQLRKKKCASINTFHNVLHKIMNITTKGNLSFSYDIPSVAFNTRKRRWENNSIIISMWFTSVSVNHDGCLSGAGRTMWVRRLAYMCAGFPSGPRSQTRRGRSQWPGRSNRCRGPNSAERGRSHRYSGWPDEGHRTATRMSGLFCCNSKDSRHGDPGSRTWSTVC